MARREQWRRQKLGDLIGRLRAGVERIGLPLMDSQTPIQPILCENEVHALALSSLLESAGFWVPAIRPPSVPEGGSRLRVSLSAAPTDADVDGLLQALERAHDSAGTKAGLPA